MIMLIHHCDGKSAAEWLREVGCGLGMYLDQYVATGPGSYDELWTTAEPMGPADDYLDISADAFGCICDGLDLAQSVNRLRALAQASPS